MVKPWKAVAKSSHLWTSCCTLTVQVCDKSWKSLTYVLLGLFLILITWVMLGDFLFSESMQCFLRSGVAAMWTTVPRAMAHYLYLTVQVLWSLTMNVHCSSENRIGCVQWLAWKNTRIEIFFVLTRVFRSSWLAGYYCCWSIFPHGKIGLSLHSTKSVFSGFNGLWHCICFGRIYRRRRWWCSIPMRCEVLVVVPVTLHCSNCLNMCCWVCCTIDWTKLKISRSASLLSTT